MIGRTAKNRITPTTARHAQSAGVIPSSRRIGVGRRRCRVTRGYRCDRLSSSSSSSGGYSTLSCYNSIQAATTHKGLLDCILKCSADLNCRFWIVVGVGRGNIVTKKTANGCNNYHALFLVRSLRGDARKKQKRGRVSARRAVKVGIDGVDETTGASELAQKSILSTNSIVDSCRHSDY